jgi:HAMP domain-containing protein
VSFRTRLVLFFALIVLVPVTVVALGLTRVADKSRTASTDAALATSAQAALAVYGDELRASTRAAREAGRDPEIATALRDGDPAVARRAVGRLVREHGLAELTVLGPSGEALASAGERGAATAELAVHGAGGPIGRVRAAVATAGEYAREVGALTGSDVALLRGDTPLAATAPIDAAGLPADDAEAELAGGEGRAMTATPDGAPDGVRVAVFKPREPAGFDASQPLLIAAGIAFLVLGLLLVVVLVRALQSQVRRMLSAAHRIGGGDFSQRVPVQGNDELAGLAREFNTMSERLGAQMHQLRDQGLELELSGRRVGEAFAATGDRRSLLEVAAETALSSCRADAARFMLTGPGMTEADAGDASAPGLREALRAAEDRALRDGVWSDGEVAGVFAMAQPLPARRGTRGRHAVMTVARARRPFGAGEREMLRYLAGKVSVPLGRIELEELVLEEALTTETGGRQ